MTMILRQKILIVVIIMKVCNVEYVCILCDTGFQFTANNFEKVKFFHLWFSILEKMKQNKMQMKW